MANCIENTTDYSSYSSGTVDGNSPRGLVTNVKYNWTVNFGNSDWNYKEVNIHINTALDPLFKETGNKFDVDWRLLAAWCWNESKFDIKAKNKKTSAAGIWQFVDKTWNANCPDGCKENAPSYTKRFDVQNSMKAFNNFFEKNLKIYSNAVSKKDRIALAIQAHHDGIVTGTSWRNMVGTQNTEFNYLGEVLNKYHEYCR